MGAMTQKQTDRYNYLDQKATSELTADEKKELNILQKINAGEDTDADNDGGDRNPSEFEDRQNKNEEGLSDKEFKQHEAAEKA